MADRNVRYRGTPQGPAKIAGLTQGWHYPAGDARTPGSRTYMFLMGRKGFSTWADWRFRIRNWVLELVFTYVLALSVQVALTTATSGSVLTNAVFVGAVFAGIQTVAFNARFGSYMPRILNLGPLVLELVSWNIGLIDTLFYLIAQLGGAALAGLTLTGYPAATGVVPNGASSVLVIVLLEIFGGALIYFVRLHQTVGSSYRHWSMMQNRVQAQTLGYLRFAMTALSYPLLGGAVFAQTSVYFAGAIASGNWTGISGADGAIFMVGPLASVVVAWLLGALADLWNVNDLSRAQKEAMAADNESELPHRPESYDDYSGVRASLAPPPMAMNAAVAQQIAASAPSGLRLEANY